MPETDASTSEVLDFGSRLGKVADNLSLCETDTEKSELLRDSLGVYVSVSCLEKTSLLSILALQKSLRHRDSL